METPPPGRLQLGEWLRANRDAVLREWEQRAQGMAKRHSLDRGRLLNHLPDLLDAIARSEDRIEAGQPANLSGRPAAIHAIDRLDAGYSLEELAEEYGLLRECLLTLLEMELPTVPRGELALLNRAIDSAVARAVKSYADTRERSIRILEQIASVAYGIHDLKDTLQMLISVILDSVGTADSASILLREGDRMVVRAAVGVGQWGTVGYALPAGVSVSGLVARSKEPLLLRDAASDPRLASPEARASGMKALYVIPLISSTEVIGTATIGSTVANEFSHEDLALFRTMATRATSLIVKAQLHAKLRDAEERYRALAESVPQIVWSADPGMLIDYVNARATEYSGTTEEAWLGPRASELVHPDDRAMVAAKYEEAIRSRGPLEAEFRMRGGDGRYRWFLARTVPVKNDAGEVIRWFGTAMDIDDRKRTEAELQRRAEFGEQILAVVSHDLRNPITAIELSSEMLSRAVLTPKLRRLSTRILSASQRAKRLIHDLLDFTRERTGRGIAISRVPMNLAPLLHQVVEEVRAAYPARRIELTQPESVRGEWDPVRMSQVASNLIINAVQHSPAESTVRVSCEAGDAEVALTVHNAGAPIPPAILPRIFEPMMRGTTEPGGTGSLGLGLFIVDRIVAAHRGEIEVTSTAEEGTTFRVRLPRAVAPLEAVAGSQPRP